MNDPEVDMALQDAMRTSQGPQPATLAHITASIQASLRPVRPARGAWVLTVGLLVLGMAVAVVGAARAGFYGFEVLAVRDRVVVLAMLVSLAGVAARALVTQWTPGSRHFLAPGALVGLLTASLLGTFAVLFTDYHATRFLAAGVVCLAFGVLHAVPAGCLAAWVLRRGLALESLAAGAVAGAFGGLCSVSVLELHCPNLEAPHVLFWHVAVVPVSAALGALVGWGVRSLRGGGSW